MKMSNLSIFHVFNMSEMCKNTCVHTCVHSVHTSKLCPLDRRLCNTHYVHMVCTLCTHMCTLSKIVKMSKIAKIWQFWRFLMKSMIFDEICVSISSIRLLASDPSPGNPLKSPRNYRYLTLWDIASMLWDVFWSKFNENMVIFTWNFSDFLCRFCAAFVNHQPSNVLQYIAHLCKNSEKQWKITILRVCAYISTYIWP